MAGDWWISAKQLETHRWNWWKAKHKGGWRPKTRCIKQETRECMHLLNWCKGCQFGISNYNFSLTFMGQNVQRHAFRIYFPTLSASPDSADYCIEDGPFPTKKIIIWDDSLCTEYCISQGKRKGRNWRANGACLLSFPLITTALP